MKTKRVVPKQQFTVEAPGATSVRLVGDFTDWQQHPIEMKRGRKGDAWKASVALTPGTHHYRFLVDGEWRDDPACALFAPNPYGSRDAIRVVA